MVQQDVPIEETELDDFESTRSDSDVGVQPQHEDFRQASQLFRYNNLDRALKRPHITGMSTSVVYEYRTDSEKALLSAARLA